MNTKSRTTIKILVFTILFLLPFLGAIAYGNDVLGNNSHIYKYNALENELSFREMVNVKDVSIEKRSGEIDLPRDIIKELQDITKKQNISVEKISVNMKALKERNVIRRFLTGNNLGTLKFQLVQIKDQIYLLEALAVEASDSRIEEQIGSQTKSLKTEKIKVEDFIKEQDGKFNLFGWLVTSF